MNVLIQNSKGVNVIEQLDSECIQCFNNCAELEYIHSSCPVDNTQKRRGCIKNRHGLAFLCTDKIKTTKLFKERLESLTLAVHQLIDIRDNIVQENELRTKRLIHNLKSINAHTIQELYDLVPQDLLTKDINSQISIIEGEMESQMRKAATTFMSIAKHNAHMKAEFSIFEKLYQDVPNFNYRKHNLRKVIMNVLHVFFSDFTKNHVDVRVEASYDEVTIDYESVHVALYHFINNASKYIKPNTTLYIKFGKDDDNTFVTYSMISLHIKDEEAQKIYEEGYSGVNARKINKAGDGIGMFRIRRLLECNKASINLHAGNDIQRYLGSEYATNNFRMIFPNQPTFDIDN